MLTNSTQINYPKMAEKYTVCVHSVCALSVRADSVLSTFCVLKQIISSKKYSDGGPLTELS